MYPRDWKLFLEKGSGREMAIAQVTSEIVSHLNAISEKVYIHHDYARKAIDRHGLKVSDFMFIFDIIEDGRALADRERHVTFMHLTPRGWFQVSVKRAEASGRLYIATFYKTNLLEVRRKTKKYQVLRNEKRAT